MLFEMQLGFPSAGREACSQQHEVRWKGENVPVVFEGPDGLELRISVVISWEFRWER